MISQHNSKLDYLWRQKASENSFQVAIFSKNNYWSEIVVSGGKWLKIHTSKQDASKLGSLLQLLTLQQHFLQKCPKTSCEHPWSHFIAHCHPCALLVRFRCTLASSERSYTHCRFVNGGLIVIRSHVGVIMHDCWQISMLSSTNKNIVPYHIYLVSNSVAITSYTFYVIAKVWKAVLIWEIMREPVLITCLTSSEGVIDLIT